MVFEINLIFQNLKENLSPLLKSVFICSQSFSKANKELISFSKSNRVPIPFLKSCERILVYSSTNRKKGTQNLENNLANRKKGTNQLTLLQVLTTQMKFKNYLSTLPKNFKNE